MLAVEHLQSAYGPAQVLFDIGFRVGAGEVVTLLGRNGMLPQGLDPAGTSPAAFAELIREDAKRWAKVIELAGIRPE